MEISKYEEGIIEIIRYNFTHPPREIYKKMVIGKLKINFQWRRKEKPWGRFGGGWNWEIGFQAGGHTIIFNLLVCSISFCWKGNKS